MKFRVDKAVSIVIDAIDEEAKYLVDEKERKQFFDRLMLYCEEQGGF